MAILRDCQTGRTHRFALTVETLHTSVIEPVEMTVASTGSATSLSAQRLYVFLVNIGKKVYFCRVMFLKID